MADFDPVKFFVSEESSQYSQLLRDVYAFTSPSSLQKFEPIIQRKYLEKLGLEEDDNCNISQGAEEKYIKDKNSSLKLDMSAQWDINTDQDRLHWLDNLLKLMESRGTPITNSPSVPGTDRRPLDLYVLFNLTMIEAGGWQLCTDKDGWKNIARKMNFPVDKSHVLARIYSKLLLPLEEHQRNQTWESSNSLPGDQKNLGNRKDAAQVQDLRARLNNNSRVSVFNRLGPRGGLESKKKRTRTRRRKITCE